MPETKSIGIGALFGAVIFVSKMVLPTPIDKMSIFIQALLLGLSSLIISKWGATYVACVGGLLTTLWRVEFAPFSLTFAVMYGLLVDGFFHLFKVRTSHRSVRTRRAVASLILSTAVMGLLSTYVTVTMGLMPPMPTLYLVIIIFGILNGALAGYLTSIIWNKYLKDLMTRYSP